MKWNATLLVIRPVAIQTHTVIYPAEAHDDRSSENAADDVMI
jgi:hypothetical protein